MSDQIVKMVVKVNAKPGSLELFKQLATELKEITETNEPAALGYEWFVNGSQACYLVETYPDSNALLAHMDNISSKLGPILDVAPLEELLVFGNLSDKAIAVLAGLGAKIFPPYTGFSRQYQQVA